VGASGSNTGLTMSGYGGVNIVQKANPGSFMGVKKFAKAGTYILAASGGNATWSTIAVALK